MRAYVDLVLSEQGISLRHFDLAREGMFWLVEHTPRYILLDQDLDLDPFAVAARIRHVRRLKEIPLAVLIEPSEKLRTTAEVVRVTAIEKPLNRDRLFRFLGLGPAKSV
nr:response regulator [Thermus albus]